MNNVNNSHHAGVFKTAPFRKLQTTYPDPNVYPNTPQLSLFSVVCPALNLLHRPRPKGWGVGEGKAGRGTFSQSIRPPPARTLARQRPTAPAPLAGQGQVSAARRGPGNSTAELAAVSGEEAVRRLTEAAAVRLPVSSLFLPPTTAPQPRPRLPLRDGRPRAQSPHKRPGPPLASLASRYRGIRAAGRGSG